MKSVMVFLWILLLIPFSGETLTKFRANQRSDLGFSVTSA